MLSMAQTKRKPPAFKAAYVAEAYRLDDLGVKRKRIAQHLNVTPETVSSWLKKYERPEVAA